MILKHEKNKILLLTIVLILISFLTVFNKQSLLIFYHNSYEGFMSTNPGFSSARNLTDSGGNIEFQSVSTKAKSIFSNSISIFDFMWNDKAKEIEKMKIIVKFKNLRKIYDDRNSAIRLGFLDSPEELKADVFYNGQKYKADIRLKGDLGDHWWGKYRFSLRVKLKNGKTILGMNSFSLQKPRARQHPYEQAFQDSIKQLGNLAVTHQYFEVSLNDQDWGVMNIEEHLTKEFLEKEGKKESLIFRFSDDLFWKNYKKSSDQVYSSYRLSDSSLTGSIYRSQKYLENDIYRMMFTYVMESRIKQYHSYLYSMPEHMRLFFASLAWNNFHTISDQNTKYYFNPYTLKLEPISSDQGMFTQLKKNPEVLIKEYNVPLNFRQAFKVFSGSKERELIFSDSFRNYENIEKYLNQYNEIFPLDQPKRGDYLRANISQLNSFKDNIFGAIDSYQIQHENNFTNEPKPSQIEDFISHLHVRHFNNGEIHIYNLLPQEVLLENILVEGISTDYRKISIPGYKSNIDKPFILESKYTGLLDNKVEVISSFKGSIRSQKAYPTMISNGVFNPLLTNNEESRPFLRKDGENQWRIVKGIWNVNEPLVLKGDVFIEAGTEMYFSNEAYLIVSGSVQIRGRESENVVFDAISDTWKGFYVLSENNEKSEIEFFNIRKTSATNPGILNLTGGFTIYSSDLQMNNVHIESSIAEDALNIVNSKVNIYNIKIDGAISDGFDCDYCNGAIRSSNISGINGDALDFSGSNIRLSNIQINDVKDKAVSVGEKSYAHIENSIFSNVGVGIASKDASSAEAYNVKINDYKLFAAMTYQKKNIFERRSELTISNSDITDEREFKRQIGTYLVVNQKEVNESELDVENMYSEGIMKK